MKVEEELPLTWAGGRVRWVKTLLRTPWPIFGIGLGLAIVGVVVASANPHWGRGASGIAVAIVIFGGLSLVAVSPALQNVRDGGEGLRKVKASFRWIVAWLLLKFAFGAVFDASRDTFDLLVGPVGSASRTIGAISIGIIHLLVPLYLAGYGAEAIRRAALWPSEDVDR